MIGVPRCRGAIINTMWSRNRSLTGFVGRREYGILAPESGKGEQTRESQGADEKCRIRLRHLLAKAAELAHVDHASHGMHHAAGAEKEKRLEEGVRHEVKHGRRNAGQKAGAQSQK